MSLSRRLRPWLIAALLQLCVLTASFAETTFETRFQYYQEDNDRIRVDSDYSLFTLDLSDTLLLDGTLLYSAISGSSPTGLPAPSKNGQVPTGYLEDERYATSLNLTKDFGTHALKGGVSYSYERDYTSWGASVQDTIFFNQKNTELVLGLAGADDQVGAAGSQLDESKQTFDALIGVNQVLGPNTLLSFNVTLGWKRGYLSEAYKRILIGDEVYLDDRPTDKFEQLGLITLTHYIESWDASVEASYRFGRNDWGSSSNTGMLALYKYMFGKRLVVRPSVRFYDQSAADFYKTQFTGFEDFASSDYRLSAEQTLNLGLQLTYNIIPEKLMLDVGYERYQSWGTDDVTAASAYPDAHSISIGLRYKF
jgi:hypothetical protein